MTGDTISFRLEGGDANVGDVFLPGGARDRLPVIVYCHGWNGSKAARPTTDALRERASRIPMAFVAFDFFASGATGGSYSDMTYGRWTRNLEAVVDWVAAQEWADPARVGCYAVSSGTTAALRLAACGRKLAFVVSVATCIGLFIDMPLPPGRLLAENLASLAAGGTAPVFGVPFGLEFFRDFLAGAPVHVLPSIACPVFFLQGANDNPWRRSDAALGYDLLRRAGVPTRHRELEGGGHGLDEVPERCADEVIHWLQEIGITR
jgi:dipeptidyl aminopeptidase/acylaminoacyl peptidase